MPLKMRPTGLGHGVYKDDVDYGVFCGEWCIGRPIRRAPDPSGWDSERAAIVHHAHNRVKQSDNALRNCPSILVVCDL
jgi:hypothetical protein